MEEIKGVIFDLDGTILDSMPLWKNLASNYLLSKNIYPKEDIDEYLKSKTLEEAILYFKSNYGINDSEEEIKGYINSIISKGYSKEVKTKQGLIQLLNNFKQQNIKMCILTANDKELTKAALKNNNISGYFLDIITCAETGKSKENPQLYEDVASFLGTNKNSTIIFEDALHSIKAAKTAGFKVIGVYDESSKKDWEYIKTITDKSIYSFQELTSLKGEQQIKQDAIIEKFQARNR